MRGGLLDAERFAAAQAVDALEFAHAWYWERDANAGPYSSEAICLGHARTSDGLILIIADEITPITRKEYNAAKRACAPRYIFLKQGVTRSDAANRFIARERHHAVTVNFQNASELQSRILDSVRAYAVWVGRREQIRRRLGTDPKRAKVRV